MTIRVLVADDHPLVRAGVSSELARYPGEFELVGDAVDGDQTWEFIQAIRPDVVLLDIHMPGRPALEVLKAVKEQAMACHVIILTAYGDTATILGMIKAGAKGYILKDEDPSILVDAIRAVTRGGVWFSGPVTEKMIAIIQGKTLPALGEKLTQREREVLLLLAEGSTNKEISVALQTSERTVEFHVGNILGKMGVKGRWEAVNLAKEKGWL